MYVGHFRRSGNVARLPLQVLARLLAYRVLIRHVRSAPFGVVTGRSPACSLYPTHRVKYRRNAAMLDTS
jgi:hypothetical protein